MERLILTVCVFFTILVATVSANIRDAAVRGGEDVSAKQEVIADGISVPTEMPLEVALILRDGRIKEWVALSSGACSDKMGWQIVSSCQQVKTSYYYSDGKISSKSQNLEPIIVVQKVKTWIVYSFLLPLVFFLVGRFYFGNYSILNRDEDVKDFLYWLSLTCLILSILAASLTWVIVKLIVMMICVVVLVGLLALLIMSFFS